MRSASSARVASSSAPGSDATSSEPSSPRIPSAPGLTSTGSAAAPANPTQSRFFRAGVPGCANCATFHGDYIGFAYGSDGHGNAVWTDQRDPSDIAGLFSQFIYFARK